MNKITTALAALALLACTTAPVFAAGYARRIQASGTARLSTAPDIARVSLIFLDRPGARFGARVLDHQLRVDPQIELIRGVVGEKGSVDTVALAFTTEEPRNRDLKNLAPGARATVVSVTLQDSPMWLGSHLKTFLRDSGLAPDRLFATVDLSPEAIALAQQAAFTDLLESALREAALQLRENQRFNGNAAATSREHRVRPQPVQLTPEIVVPPVPVDFTADFEFEADNIKPSRF